jgi:hypothetical protein
MPMRALQDRSREPHENLGLDYASVWSMLVAGPGGSPPILLGRYRLPLRCQTITIVNLPINGSTTSTLIIS